MPLSERDPNARQHNPRNKRYSITPESLPGAENAAPAPDVPRTKGGLSRQQHFLAPTKASSAKTTPPTLDRKVQHPHSGRNTPQQRPHKLPKTKLPKRDGATFPIVPPISKWSLPLANRTDRFAQTSLPASQSSPLFSHATQIAQAQSPVSSHTLDTLDRQAPAEKPLPSRPIVTLMDGPSPTKNSRCLLDASEKPIHLSIAGSEHEWPTLIPSPSTTPTMESTPPTMAADQTQPFSRSGRRAFSNSSRLSTSPELARTINGQLSQEKNTTLQSPDERPGSPSSYVSASEDTNSLAMFDSPSDRYSTRVRGPRPLNLTPMMYPPRKSSLQDHSPNSSPYNGSPYGRAQNSAMSTRTTDSALQSPLMDSRPHSPSPANFSRLRPTSTSQPSAGLTTATGAALVKTPKTASRIPLPDSKKATLVDIKSRRSSGIPTPKLEKGQSFGARRMNSPDPLTVLDSGIKRRQLASADTSGSTSTSSTVPTKVLNTGSASRNHSKTSFPGSTTGRSSDDEEEISTPTDKSPHLVKHGFRPKHLNRASGGHYGGATLKVYNDAEVVLGRPPPSNSPFTGPLQTIHSQSALPLVNTHSRESSEGRFVPKVVIKPTEFGGFASRLSKMQNIQGSSARNSRAHYSVVSNRSDLLPDRAELVDVLKEAEHEDALISQCGALGLDTSTREDIKQTLSMLEGHSGPAITAVDPEKLSLMIGRLKLGFEKAPKSAAFIEDATVAERFLARRGSTASDSVARVIMAKANGGSRDITPRSTEGDAESHHSRSKTVASKWSNSSSDKDLSLTLTNNDLAHHTDDYDGHLPMLPSKEDSHMSTGSIGYPNRINGKAQRIIGPDERSIVTQKTGIRRVSSPTLGDRVPGSVRVAREKAKSAAGEIASHSIVSDKFKTNKMPTPNTKAFQVDDPPRGRKLSIGKSGSKGSTPKTPRSRSKSRYVLDKINVLFTGKRDKRQSSIPPVPPLKNIKQRPLAGKKGATITTPDSPLPLPPRTPPLTKMPTISPPVDAVHPALRSATSAASFAQSATTIAGHADYEDRDSVQAWSEKLVGRAKQEGDPARKERLLNFAKVLNDSLISAREAQISAETAQTAARSAQLSYEMTMKSVAMLQRLASSMNRR